MVNMLPSKYMVEVNSFTDNIRQNSLIKNVMQKYALKWTTST
jgi:hypothetical protein